RSGNRKLAFGRSSGRGRRACAPLHQPRADEVAQGAGDDAAENIGDIVVASPNCGNTHCSDERQDDPEEPAPVTPGSPNDSHGASDMFGGKCGATYAAVMFDEINGGRERTAVEFALPHAGHGKPRALNG